MGVMMDHRALHHPSLHASDKTDSHSASGHRSGVVRINARDLQSMYVAKHTEQYPNANIQRALV